jgi:hypothetical protein
MAQAAPWRTKINTEVTQAASGRGSRPPAGRRKPGRPPRGPRVSGDARESVRSTGAKISVMHGVPVPGGARFAGDPADLAQVTDRGAVAQNRGEVDEVDRGPGPARRSQERVAVERAEPAQHRAGVLGQPAGLGLGPRVQVGRVGLRVGGLAPVTWPARQLRPHGVGHRVLPGQPGRPHIGPDLVVIPPDLRGIQIRVTVLPVRRRGSVSMPSQPWLPPPTPDTHKTSIPG